MCLALFDHLGVQVLRLQRTVRPGGSHRDIGGIRGAVLLGPMEMVNSDPVVPFLGGLGYDDFQGFLVASQAGGPDDKGLVSQTVNRKWE